MAKEVDEKIESLLSPIKDKISSIIINKDNRLIIEFKAGEKNNIEKEVQNLLDGLGIPNHKYIPGETNIAITRDVVNKFIDESTENAIERTKLRENYKDHFNALQKETLSYNDWLKDKYSIVAKQEVHSIEKLTDVGVRFVFPGNSAHSFIERYVQYQIDSQKLLPDDKKTKINQLRSELKFDSVVFGYSLQIQDKQFLDNLNQEYKKETKPRTKSAEEIKSQLKELSKIEKSIMWPHKNISLRILRRLMNDKQNGWNRVSAASAYNASLLAFQAINRDQLSSKEQNNITKALSVFKGSSSIIKDSEKATNHDLIELFLGEFGLRRLIQSYYSVNDAEKKVDELMTNGDPKNSKSDEVIISTGYVGHAVIVRYWKQGVDKNDNPVKEGEAPDHYRFYRTEYNAGASTKHKDYEEWTSDTISTTEIKPFEFNKDGATEYTGPKNNPKYYQAVANTIKQLIICERELSVNTKPKGTREARDEKGNVVFDKLKPKGAINKVKSFFSKGSDKRWVKNRNLRRQLKGKYVEEYSRVGAMQRSGNCTVMSIHNMAKDKLGESLAQDHLNFIQGNTPKDILKQIHQKKKELKIELAKLEPDKTIKKDSRFKITSETSITKPKPNSTPKVHPTITNPTKTQPSKS